MKDKDRHMESNDPFKQLLRETAMEQAPDNLIQDVMKTIESQTAISIAAKPLISRKGWTAIILGVIAICLLSMIPLGDAVQSTESLIPQEWIPNYQFSLPEIPVIPKAAWTGILAFGVFALVHLYWMKHQLTRQGML